MPQRCPKTGREVPSFPSLAMRRTHGVNVSMTARWAASRVLPCWAGAPSHCPHFLAPHVCILRLQAPHATHFSSHDWCRCCVCQVIAAVCARSFSSLPPRFGMEVPQSPQPGPHMRSGSQRHGGLLLECLAWMKRRPCQPWLPAGLTGLPAGTLQRAEAAGAE